MKQRLLLALLVLFASVGTMWANITFTVPSNIGTVTLTVTGDEADQCITVADDATITYSNRVYTIKNNTSSPKEYTILDKKITELTFSVSGGATVTDISGDGIGTITKITAENVGLETINLNLSALTTLDISGNKIADSNFTSSNSTLPSLSTLDVSNNKLTGFGLIWFINHEPSTDAEWATKIDISGNSIPNVTNSDKYKSLTWGTQYISYSTTTPKANEWFGTVAKLVNGLHLFTYNNTLTYDKLNISWHPQGKTNSIATANEIGDVKFYSGSTWFSGVAECTISQKNVSNGPKYVVTLNVNPATFTITKNVTAGKGSIRVFNGQTEITTGTVSPDDMLTIITSPNDGYVLDANSLKTVGMTKSGDQYKVIGSTTSDNLEIQAAFKAIEYTINHSGSGNGTYEIKCDGETLTSGTKLTYDKELSLSTVSESGFKARVFINENTEVALTNGVATIKLSDYVSKTQAGTLAIKVMFEANDNYVINVGWPSEGLSKLFINTSEFTSAPTDGSVKIVPGNTVSLQVVVADGYKLNGILIDAESKTTSSKLTFTMPKKSIKITFDIVKLSTLTVATKSGVTYTYTGADQDFQYEVKDGGTVVNITDFTIKYSRDNGVTWTDKKPKEVASYKVRMIRAAKDGYSAIDESNLSMSIGKATPTLTAPTVSVNTQNVYTISGGSAKLGNSTVPGTFKVSKAFNGSTWETVTNNMCTINKSHNVELTFEPTDKTNFTSDATIRVAAKYQNSDAVASYKISLKNIPSDMTLKVYNGSSEVTSSTTVYVGTELTFVLTYPKGYNEVYLYEEKADAKKDFDVTNATNNKTETSDPAVNVKTVKVTFDSAPSAITVKYKDSPVLMDLTVEIKNAVDAKEYKPEGQTLSELYKADNFTFKINGTTLGDAESGAIPAKSTVAGKMIISYKDKDGKVVAKPTEVGKYTVCVSIPAIPGADDKSSIKATEVEFKDKLEIEPATIAEGDITWPASAVVALGQTLKDAVFLGGAAPKAGSFAFIDGSITPKNGESFAVKFVPASSNYKETVKTIGADGTGKVKVTISSSRVLVIDQLENGSVTVKGNDGNTYKSGDALPTTVTSITITTTPATGYKLASLTVNGTVISDGASFTLGTTSVSIKATFEEIKEFTVSVSTSVKGIQLVLPSSNVVKKGAAYSFSVKGLAADLANLVVSDGTTTYAGTNGAYTISNITANKTITVTMKAGTAPTQVEAVIEANLSTQGKSMGTVTVTKISSLRADAVDSSIQKFYYGDKIRITATPAAGCRFVGWEGRTETSSVIDVIITETSYKFKAVFAGSPTGAEVIEGVDIYGSNGEIVVKCDGAARITIVSMNGQSKQQEISGDTRIPAGAGIYGIVFEQGNNVMRTKVAVK